MFNPAGEVAGREIGMNPSKVPAWLLEYKGPPGVAFVRWVLENAPEGDEHKEWARQSLPMYEEMEHRNQVARAREVVISAAKAWDKTLDAEHMISFASPEEEALVEAVTRLNELERP